MQTVIRKDNSHRLQITSRNSRLLNTLGKYKPFQYKKNKTDDPPNSVSRPFNLAQIKKSNRSIAELFLKPQQEKYASVAVFLYEFIQSHPEFDVDFKLDTNLDAIDLMIEIFNKIKTIFPDSIIRLDLSNFEIPHVLFYHNSGVVYGSSSGFDFLPKLNNKNKPCFNLLTQFLCIISIHIGQDLFFNEDIEQALEYLEEIIENDNDNDNHNQRLNRALLLKYNGIATRYFSKINVLKDSISIASFEQELKNYHPRLQVYKNIKEWMEQGLSLAKSPYNLNQFYEGYHIFNTDELHTPNQSAFQMVWSNSDFIWDISLDRLNDYAGNNNIMPFIYSQAFSTAPIDWNSITMPSFLNKYQEFMSIGSQYNYELSEHLQS